MKVLCIAKGWVKTQKEKNRPSPQFGETYTVTQSKYATTEAGGEIGLPGVYYQLAEMHSKSGFHSSRFLELSNIDETERVREKLEIKVL